MPDTDRFYDDYYKRRGFIYFIQEDARNSIKIGFTSGNPRDRLRHLSTPIGPRLEIIGVQIGTLALETKLHKRFRNLRIGREWFRPEPSLLYYISKLDYGDTFGRELQELLTSMPRYTRLVPITKNHA